MKIKIMHIIDTLNVGGLENGVVNLVNKLDVEKYSHVICCIRAIGPMARRIRNEETKIICMESRSRDYLMPFKLRKIMKNVGPDIVHTRNWGSIDGIIAANLTKVGGIIHGEHGRDYEDLGGMNSKRNLVRRVLAPTVDYFIALSGEIRHWLLHTVIVPSRKVVKIMNGVDTRRFCPPETKAQAKKDVGLDANVRIIGTVGRLDKVKNYEVLLEALCRLDDTVPDHRLVFVGDGPERSSLQGYANKRGLNNVLFLGQKDRVSDFIQAFDFFVLPSLGEGLSNTILESLATGVAVLATNVGGNSELIQDNVTGILFPPGDVEALTMQIDRFLRDGDICKNMGESGRFRALNEFSLDRMLHEYDRVYSKVMKQVSPQ